MNKEREKSILEIAIKEKAVTVKNLAQRLYSSEPSIRRDLCNLEKQGLLKRTHGGAGLNENNISCIGTGGEVINSCLAFVGEEANRTIERYNADFCFFACRGISEDGRLTDISEPENSVRAKMLEHSKQAYMLCTSDKMNKLYYHNLCSADDITGIIKAEAADSCALQNPPLCIR